MLKKNKKKNTFYNSHNPLCWQEATPEKFTQKVIHFMFAFVIPRFSISSVLY